MRCGGRRTLWPAVGAGFDIRATAVHHAHLVVGHVTNKDDEDEHMTNRTRQGCLVAMAVVGLGAVGCGDATGGSPSGTGAVTATRGGDLVIARAEDGTSLDPAQGVSPADTAATNQMFDRLYDVSQDGKLVPSLAASSTTSADGRTLRITLRDGVTFSNGSPLTSADVKFSLDRSRKAEAGFSFLLGGIGSVSAPDARTVVIRTPVPAATLKAALSAWVASILPNDLGGQTEKAFFARPIGSGPFTFSSRERGTTIKLVRNERYWKKGRPLLDSVTWNRVPDSNTRVAQVQSGQADVVSDAPYSQLSSLRAGGRLQARSFPANFTSFLILNQDVKPLADVHVRRAMAHAIDRASLTKGTLFGSGTAACSMVPPTMPYADERAPCLRFDLAAAKAEMAKSTAPGGFAAELTIDNLPTSASVAQIVQASLAPIGIRLKIKTVDSGQLYTVFDNAAFQVGLGAWASDIPDPDEQLSFMLDPKAGGNAYYTGYDNPKVNALLVEGQTELSTAGRSAIYRQIQGIAASEVPQIPLSNQDGAYLWGTGVQGFEVNPMGTIDLAGVGKSR
jgi:peptide/nickel transport system substrate-binding protein